MGNLGKKKNRRYFLSMCGSKGLDKTDRSCRITVCVASRTFLRVSGYLIYRPFSYEDVYPFVVLEVREKFTSASSYSVKTNRIFSAPRTAPAVLFNVVELFSIHFPTLLSMRFR
ncbi:hypothetical protein A2380_01720 [candidate division WWE3 bacterium RIFOXYB1_FULL_43_24]|nr:MAG: hypothetical protein A2212_01480 [candidate division WWE3 bacterium RIFOXYA1_FULL_42_9]OGC69639.1 MAG: hypothetical protein A2380_01720 [candidate division WWE3 bacterium RIFOXYB1_FULL_43_24]OGC73129.1 MAG: hypothetical protein A2414_00765 [candidate division WWE3 bacterium RIFOXYC1_FULL_42_13]